MPSPADLSDGAVRETVHLGEATRQRRAFPGPRSHAPQVFFATSRASRRSQTRSRAASRQDRPHAGTAFREDRRSRQDDHPGARPAGADRSLLETPSGPDFTSRPRLSVKPATWSAQILRGTRPSLPPPPRDRGGLLEAPAALRGRTSAYSACMLRHLLLSTLVLMAMTSLGCYTVIQRPEVSPRRPYQDVTDQGPRIEVTTDAAEYPASHRRPETEVTMIIRHQGGPPVWLRGCPKPPSGIVDRWEDSEWKVRLWFGIVCSSLSTEKTLLVEGDTLTDRIMVREPGHYRIRLIVRPHEGTDDYEVASEEFIVH